MSWPEELRIAADRTEMSVLYPDGTRHDLPAEFLRVLTPSAERKGHGTPMVVGGKAAVKIADVRQVGRYAVRIVFDDGHDSGLYTLAYLDELGTDRERLWSQYLDDLARHGLTRDKPGVAALH
nr:DUF971 domain-containing protein [Acuticoccus kandeliae]